MKKFNKIVSFLVKVFKIFFKILMVLILMISFSAPSYFFIDRDSIKKSDFSEDRKLILLSDIFPSLKRELFTETINVKTGIPVMLTCTNDIVYRAEGAPLAYLVAYGSSTCPVRYFNPIAFIINIILLLLLFLLLFYFKIKKGFFREAIKIFIISILLNNFFVILHIIV